MVRPSHLQAFLGDESQGMPDSGRQAEAVESIGDIPLIVLTARLNEIPGWQEWQNELLQLSSDSQQLFANTGHNVEIEEPDAAINAILKMVDIVRRSIET